MDISICRGYQRASGVLYQGCAGCFGKLPCLPQTRNCPKLSEEKAAPERKSETARGLLITSYVETCCSLCSPLRLVAFRSGWVQRRA